MRARWLSVLAGLAALAASSSAALAECFSTDFGGVVAALSETCNFYGSYSTSVANRLAAQATSLGILNAWPDDGGTLSYSTSGASANAVQADTGGSVTLNGSTDFPGTVATTGGGSNGLYSTGFGPTEGGVTVQSNIAATDIEISTTNANAVQADNGGHITLTGGSVTASGAGTTSVFATGAGSQITTNNVAILNTGAITSSRTANAVDADSGAVVEINGGTAETTKNSAFAVLATQGGTLNLNGVGIVTIGDGSGGIGLNGSGSIVNATGVNVSTSGNNDTDTGFCACGAFNGSYPTDPGGGVMTITDSVFRTSGAHALGIDTTDGGATKIFGGSVTTTGLQSQGVLAMSGAQVTVQGTTISTSGNASKGLYVQDTGSVLTANGVRVTTTGTINPATGEHAQALYNGNGSLTGVDPTGGGVAIVTDSIFLTKGVDSVGIDTLDGGRTTVTGGSIATEGVRSAAVVADSSAFVSATGASISTTAAGSTGLAVNGMAEADAKNVIIATTGGVDSGTGDHSDGVYNGPSGSFKAGGVVKLTDTSVSTIGAGGNGVSTSSGGTTTVDGGSINTAGNAAYAVTANGGGFATLNGTTIDTTGNGSGGLGINGAGSEIDATNVTISTTGGFDSGSGQHSYGVYNGYFGTFPTGGVATITNSTISTQGLKMYGVFTTTGGVTNLIGDSVATTGQDAHALLVSGSGSQASLGGVNSFATQGAGASGIVASLGGVIGATGSTSVTTSGGVSTATGFGANGVAADGAGAQVLLGAATITTSGPGGFALIAANSTGSGSAGSITATGTLNIKTTNAAAAAVGLQGNGATILAPGGGTISSAGKAIEFLGGSNQTATFENFTINSPSGDLVFADPSTATINFNTTIANAGSGNLLNATAGSAVTFNANASTLTGAISTDPTSTSNVNLTNATAWNLTGPSTVTNLAVTNSIVIFAPPSAGGGFKTLTVTNYVGSGANMTMNAALGGSTQRSDQIVVNGGAATGLTLLTIKNVSGLGGQTSGSGVPLVIATNGGTIAPGAFALAGVPLFGGYRYMLDQSDGDLYLVSTPAPTVAGVTNSVTNVAKAQQNQIITNRVLNSVLLGATQQISSCSCGGGFASVGSFAAGAQGRWGLSDELTLIGGFSYNQWNASGITVQNAPTIAGSLVYDLWKWGESRPFFGVGGALTPYEDVHYTRSYANGLTTAVGNASAIDRDLSLFARAGWIDRLTPTDEAAVYGDLSRSWMQTGGYTEMTSALNPFPATVSNGLDTLNVARIGGQITHLFNGNIEANVSAAVAYGFGAGAGAATNVFDFGPIAPNALPNTTWVEYGARVGYRFSDRLVVDAFLVGTAFGEVGATVHGGVGLRFAF